MSRYGAPPNVADSVRDLGLLAEQTGAALRQRGETVAVAEGSCGGLISAALLAVPGASAYYVGGAVAYTAASSYTLFANSELVHPGRAGATEEFVRYAAGSVATLLSANWGLAEGGTAGPSQNRYGDPVGQAWVAVAGPTEATARIQNGSAARLTNMATFARSALDLLIKTLAFASEEAS